MSHNYTDNPPLAVAPAPKPTQRWSLYWPALVSIVVLWVVVAVLLRITMARNEGHLIYALDDPYIHMALARNFALHGVWGMTPYAFSSASSSVLWTLLLAGVFRLTGVHGSAPFVINLLCATGIVLILDRALIRRKWTGPARALALIGFIFVIPLPTLIFSGMEHALQILLVMIFLLRAVDSLSSPAPATFRAVFSLCAIALLVSGVRYDDLFLVAVVCLLFFLRRQFIAGLAIGFAAMLPVFLYGLYSVAHGGFWLPNSVLLKGMLLGLTCSTHAAGSIGSLKLFGRSLVLCPYLLVPIAGAGVYVFRRGVNAKQWWEPGVVLGGIFLGTTFFHLLFAQTGWFFRYEAYLVTIGVYLLLVYLGEIAQRGMLLRSPSAAMLLVALACLLPFTGRARSAIQNIPYATTNIYQQQYQMARFLHTYYEGASVAANDIGAINFFADIKCFDLVGLADRDVAIAKLQKHYQQETIDRLARQRGVQIAIVYDVVPKSANWVAVGGWKIPHNVVCARNSIAFFGATPDETAKLKAHLHEFNPSLPAGVLVLPPEKPSHVK